MRLQNPFAALGPTGLDSQVLTVLARSDAQLTTSQIHGLLPEGGSLEGVRLATRRLAEQGVVNEYAIGNAFSYGLNSDHLLATPIQQIARAKQRLVELLASEIVEWDYQPLTVSIFGSAARDEMHNSSDIDIFVVMTDEAEPDRTEELVNSLVHRASVLTGNDVRALLYYRSEVKPSAVFDSILAEGLSVAGDPGWLRKHLRTVKAKQ